MNMFRKQKNKKGVREILLRGVFWRLLVIEAILLVWSVGYRWGVQGADTGDLFWYAVRIIILVMIILALMMITLRGFLNEKIILPLEAVASANRRYQRSNPGDLEYVFSPDTPKEVLEIVQTREQMLKTILETSEERLRLVNFIRETFGRYLSTKVVDEILESPDGWRVGGKRQTVTILMSDLRGFTSLSERQDPEEMVRLLNRYLERMSKIIVSYEGVIDEFIGDAILAVFGVPEPGDDDPLLAVACAISMQNSLIELNEELVAEGYPPLEMGIGINTGSVIVGNIGSEVRIKYGVVGAAVNSTAGIESHTVGGQILVGESTCSQIKDKVRTDSPRTAMMKGMTEPLVFYSVIGMDSPYKMELKTTRDQEQGAEIRLPIHFWVMDGNEIHGEPGSGQTQWINENLVDIQVDRQLEIFDNLKFRFEFCVDAHCFDDIYAKVLSTRQDHHGHQINRIGITTIDRKDREILKKWVKEVE